MSGYYTCVEPLTLDEYKQWVTALRSGDYKQGKNVLETLDGKFCCLGVLAKIKGKLNNRAFYGSVTALKTYHGGYCYLSASDLGNDLTQETLMEMNDNGITFDKIADFIEEHMHENVVKYSNT